MYWNRNGKVWKINKNKKLAFYRTSKSLVQTKLILLCRECFHEYTIEHGVHTNVQSSQYKHITISLIVFDLNSLHSS